MSRPDRAEGPGAERSRSAGNARAHGRSCRGEAPPRSRRGPRRPRVSTPARRSAAPIAAPAPVPAAPAQVRRTFVECTQRLRICNFAASPGHTETFKFPARSETLSFFDDVDEPPPQSAPRQEPRGELGAASAAAGRPQEPSRRSRHGGSCAVVGIVLSRRARGTRHPQLPGNPDEQLRSRTTTRGRLPDPAVQQTGRELFAILDSGGASTAQRGVYDAVPQRSRQERLEPTQTAQSMSVPGADAGRPARSSSAHADACAKTESRDRRRRSRQALGTNGRADAASTRSRPRTRSSTRPTSLQALLAAGDGRAAATAPGSPSAGANGQCPSTAASCSPISAG